MKDRDGKRLYRLSDILVVFVLLSIGSIFISWELFWFVGSFTGILAGITLITNWDSIIIWWSTHNNKRK